MGIALKTQSPCFWQSVLGRRAARRFFPPTEAVGARSYLSPYVNLPGPAGIVRRKENIL